MSSESPPKTVSLDPEDTGRHETAVSSAKRETAVQHVTTPIQQRRPLPSTRPDNNAKRGFDSTNDATLRIQSKKRKTSHPNLDSNKTPLPCFNFEQLKGLEASYSENGAQPNEDEVDTLAIQTGQSREAIESWFAAKRAERGMAWQPRMQQSRASQAQAPSYAPETPSSFVHDVESHHTHDELAVAQSMVELTRPLRDIQALPAPGPPPQSPHAITGDQSTISPIGLVPTPAQPIAMQPNNPEAMLPQDQITLLDRFFPHATWIQNPGGYSKVLELMRHAKYRSLTQIGGGPFTKSNELAAVVRNKFVNDYRRTHGEAVFTQKNGNVYKAQNDWFKSLSLNGKNDYIHYVMRQLVRLLTVNEQRKINDLKQGMTMAVGSGSGTGMTNIGLHTEIGTSRGNTNERVTGGMGFMSTAAPGGPIHGGAANGMSLARNPTSSAVDIVSVGGSTAVTFRPLLPKPRDTGSGTGNKGGQNRGSGDGLSNGNTLQQADQTVSEKTTATQMLAPRDTRNATNLPNPQTTPAITQIAAVAPNTNSRTNDPVRSSIQAIMQEIKKHRGRRFQLGRKIEDLENHLAKLL